MTERQALVLGKPRMRAARAGGLTIAIAGVVVVVLTGGTAARAGGTPPTTYLDKAGRFSITVPRTWQVVPRTVPQVQGLVRQLTQKKQTALADAYSLLISTSAGKDALKNFRFQAFLWPPISAVPTDVSVALTSIPKSFGVGKLPAIGARFASQLAANKGAKITAPRTIELKSGLSSEFIEGSIPAAAKQEPATGFELYLIVQPKTHILYELSFRIDAAVLDKAVVFKSIADNFRIVE